MRNFALNIPRSLQQHPPTTLSRDAKQRLRVLDWYRSHKENARWTCRHFGISPDTFYRWKRRYNPKILTTRESRSHWPHYLRQPTWSPELATAVLQLRSENPRWGKEKLMRLLHAQNWGVSVSMVGRILTHLKATGQMRETPGPGVSVVRQRVVLDILANFTLFATDRYKRRSKVICRYQQYDATNKIVERVVASQPQKGLIGHFLGSDKSLLMAFAAQKLRLHPLLKSPTVLIVVDRIDLDTQITGTFTAANVPNLEKAETGERLRQLLAQDVRKVIITTIFKFA